MMTEQGFRSQEGYADAGSVSTKGVESCDWSPHTR